jgi:hypothetical protein
MNFSGTLPTDYALGVQYVSLLVYSYILPYDEAFFICRKESTLLKNIANQLTISWVFLDHQVFMSKMQLIQEAYLFCVKM